GGCIAAARIRHEPSTAAVLQIRSSKNRWRVRGRHQGIAIAPCDIAAALRDDVATARCDNVAPSLSDDIAAALGDDVATTGCDNVPAALRDNVPAACGDDIATTLGDHVASTLSNDVAPALRDHGGGTGNPHRARCQLK